MVNNFDLKSNGDSKALRVQVPSSLELTKKNNLIIIIIIINFKIWKII